MKTFGISLCALMTLLFAMPLMAAPTGTVYGNNGQTTGKLRWMQSSKKYVVTTDKLTVEYPLDEVERIEVDRPKNLDSAIKNSSVAALESIAKEYSHMTYDREATRWLVEIYLKQNNAAKAVSACEAVIRNDRDAAYKGEMAVAYWKALTKAKKTSDLNRLLDKAIASGDQDSATAALVARGNAIMERGNARANCEEALRDGYLRVILLYADPASDAYAEALYKGAQAFDTMGQGSRANALRDKLKSECRSSTWARK